MGFSSTGGRCYLDWPMQTHPFMWDSRYRRRTRTAGGGVERCAAACHVAYPRALVLCRVVVSSQPERSAWCFCASPSVPGAGQAHSGVLCSACDIAARFVACFMAQFPVVRPTEAT